MSRLRFYYERGQLVEVITWWAGRGPRNVLIRRADGQLVVRPFRGLRRASPARDALGREAGAQAARAGRRPPAQTGDLVT